MKTAKIVALALCYFLCIQILPTIAADAAQDFTKIRLDSKWQFIDHKNVSSKWMPATVPGTVHTDLWDNKVIEAPYYGTHESQLQWIEMCNWTYTTTFDAPNSILSKKNVHLVFYGLDTHAEVFLNNNSILKADNMFRKWSVDVKSHLLATGNNMTIEFTSPVLLDNAKNTQFYLPSDNSRIWSRKAAYHYGWDWGPRFVTSGVWQPIYFEAYDKSFIEAIRIAPIGETTGSEESITVTVDVEMHVTKSVAEDYLFKVSFAGSNNYGATQTIQLDATNNQATIEFPIEDPIIWWPNGYGEQHMYNVSIEVLQSDKLIDMRYQTFGLRTVEVIQEKDSIGESFYFRVNGVSMFMKGANYIPPTMFMPSATLDNYTYIVKTAKDSNYNMIRLWGGGNFESDDFYRLCDEYGIMIWHDFMFAGGMYPGDDEYSENVKQEHIYQVKRLRNHPSIAMWCGNNEVREGWEHWGWGGVGNSQIVWSWYIKIFETVIPEVIAKYDGTRFYWPTSPRHGWGSDLSYKEGDSHYWGVWHGMSDFESLNDRAGRFVSEYGMQGGVDLNCIKTYTKPEDRFMSGSSTSDAMKVHQKHRSGFQNLEGYLNKYYKGYHTFENYVYLTQAVQALGIQMGIEFHRRKQPNTMGTLYWQLNDVWPVFSWSSMDYYGGWKALQWRAKKYYQDIMLSVGNEGNHVQVYVVSEKLESVTGILSMKVMTVDGTVIWQHKKGVFVKRGSRIAYSEEINKVNGGSNSKSFMYIKLVTNTDPDHPQSFEHFYYFVRPNAMDLKKPNIQIKDAGNKQISVSTDVLARDVYLFVDDSVDKVVFEDNFFDLAPGQERIISFKASKGIDTIIDNIDVFNIYDSSEKPGRRDLEKENKKSNMDSQYALIMDQDV
jgi:beta-mannosidase